MPPTTNDGDPYFRRDRRGVDTTGVSRRFGVIAPGRRRVDQNIKDGLSWAI